MTAPALDPGRLLFERHLKTSGFESGVSQGFWRHLDTSWPYATFIVKVGSDGELAVRLLLDGYPTQAPAGQPWDLELGSVLAQGRWSVGGPEPQVFRPDWSPSNGFAPYLACDRIALAGHPDWRSTARAWNAECDVAFYLRELHRDLRPARLPAKAAGAA